MAWTIDETLKLIKKHTNPFSFLTTDNPQNYYDEEILILEDHLKIYQTIKRKLII